MNVSNKAQHRQQVIRAQARKKTDEFLKKQKEFKARKAAEALQVVCV